MKWCSMKSFMKNFIQIKKTNLSQIKSKRDVSHCAESIFFIRINFAHPQSLNNIFACANFWRFFKIKKYSDGLLIYLELKSTICPSFTIAPLKQDV